MDKYGEMGDSLYCYPGTNTLKNKLNIRDEHILEQAELELSGLASSLIEYAEPPYDLKYLKINSFTAFWRLIRLGRKVKTNRYFQR